MIEDNEITRKQEEVLELLPETRSNIAEELGISRRSVRYRMKAMEKNTDISFKRDSDGIWHRVDNVFGSATDERNEWSSVEIEPKRVNSYDKAQITKDVHNTLTEMEKEIKEALANSNPVVYDYSRSRGNSTLVIPHSDAHVGAVVDERYDVDYYDADRAREVIGEYFDRCINHAGKRDDVEDAVVIFNGDHLDGEGIFQSQRHEQEDNLREQQRKAGRTYIEQILKLADEFEHVYVYQVPGNHGRLDFESTTNADMMLYDFIEVGIDYSGVENVHIEKAGAGGFLNFTVRGWDYHCRHGEELLEHVGTSSGKNRVQNHYMQYFFDIMIRSHYHAVKSESIGDNIPIIMTGSTAPQSTFAEERSAGGGKYGVCWFTTENNIIEDFQPIDLKSGDLT